MSHRVPGLFVTGTDTEVGKTHVAAMIVRQLVRSGRRVGVYKPAASGCRWEGNTLVSDDALTLWKAAGRPGELDRVCPQRFEAPLAPPLAAQAEGKQVDDRLLSKGLDYWRACSDVIVVEGVGGLMSPLGNEGSYVAELADAFRLPLVIVARNALGTINHTVLTYVTAIIAYGNIPLGGIVLNNPTPPGDDPSVATNRRELADHCSGAPMLAEVAYGADQFDAEVDWWAVCQSV